MFTMFELLSFDALWWLLVPNVLIGHMIYQIYDDHGLTLIELIMGQHVADQEVVVLHHTPDGLKAD